MLQKKNRFASSLEFSPYYPSARATFWVRTWPVVAKWIVTVSTYIFGSYNVHKKYVISSHPIDEFGWLLLPLVLPILLAENHTLEFININECAPLVMNSNDS